MNLFHAIMLLANVATSATLANAFIVVKQCPVYIFKMQNASSHLSATSSTNTNDGITSNNYGNQSSRSKFLKEVLQTTTLLSLSSTVISLPATNTIANAATTQEEKQYNLSPEEIAQIVTKDITQNSFLTNGQLTRSIYDEEATFTDEIDTYTLPQWIKGTAQLFVPPSKGGSRVGLVGDVIADQSKVEFRFEEDLMFNIPFKPIVFVSGKVILDRDLQSGLITSYREFWDQDVGTVLKSARFK